MAYIGRNISNLSDRAVLDNITASATATYNLLLNGVAYVPSSAESLTVSLNGVIQKPQSSYTVSGSTIVFDSALTSSDSIDFILAERAITLTTVGSGSVGTSQLVDGSVSNSKLANSSITLNGSAVSLGGSATIGGGKIGQVVSTTQSGTVSISSSSTSTFVDITGLSVNITPTSTSSKICIFYVVHAGADAGSRHIRLMRDSTAINIGDAAGGSQIIATSSARPNNATYDFDTANMAGQFLDSPNKNSQVTYKLQATLGATYSGTFYLNRPRSSVNADYSPVMQSTISVMEVLA